MIDKLRKIQDWASPLGWFALAAALCLAAYAVWAFAVYPYIQAQSPYDERGLGPLNVALASFSAETLDPSMDNQDGARYHAHIYDPMIGANPQGRLHSPSSASYGIIDDWSVAPDGMAYTLNLRQSALWHDGQAADADDLAASFSHYIREGAACGVCGNLRDEIASVDFDGERGVSVRLNDPNVVFLGLLAPVEGDAPLLPRHILDGGEGALDARPVGSGPWRFAARGEGESVDYESNPDYWNPERFPGYDTLHIVQAPEEAARLALLHSGAADIAPVGIDAIPDLKAEGFTIDGPKHVISTTLRFLMSYDDAHFTSDPRFRNALAWSVDARDVVNSFYPPEAADAAIGSALFTPISPGYDAGLEIYPTLPEDAERLLNETSYAGEPITILSLAAYGLNEMPGINEMIAGQFRTIGVNAQVQPVEWPSLQPSLLSRPQQLDQYGQAPVLHGAAPSRPGGDINAVRRYLSGADGAMLTYFSPHQGDDVLRQLEGQPNPYDRAALLRELAQKTYSEYWAIPILWRHHTYALSDGISLWEPTNGTGGDLRFETVR